MRDEKTKVDKSTLVGSGISCQCLENDGLARQGRCHRCIGLFWSNTAVGRLENPSHNR